MDRERWSRLKALFDEATGMEAEGRRAFLDELRTRDSTLYDDLCALLAADAVDTLPVDGDPGSMLGLDADEGAGTEPGPDPRVGSRVGPWEVEERLGEGGMGVVYRARRADGEFDQSVALKVLRRGMDTEGILNRFRNERQILASLEHPNIARLVDGGMTDDGLPWFSMEYVRGRHLTRYCDDLQLSVGERIALFETVCSAVQYAQERLVVHRDLKPSNVLVADDGTVKLLDFGIARMLDDGGAEQTTQVGGPRPLTLAYAAPEQVDGGSITTATDVYALGTILYELLTGVRPRDVVDSGDPRKPSDMVTQTQRTISAARSIEPTALRRRLRGDLDTICLKALRADPERRYATAGDLLDDLRLHREGRPVTARPDTFGYRASRFVGRNRLAVFGSAAAALLMIGTAGIYTVRLAEERDRARLAAAEAQEVTDFLEGIFETSDPGESLGREITAAELLETGRRRIEVELVDQPRIQAAILATIGRVYRNLSLFEEARPLLTRALELRVAELGPDHADIAESLRDLALLARQTDRFAEADSLQRLALDMGLRLEGSGSAGYGRDVASLGAIATEAGEWDAADSILRVALDLQRAALGEDHEDIAGTLHTLGAVVYRERDFERAADLFRQSWEMYTRLRPEGHPDVVRGYDDLGDALSAAGQPERAEEIAREVVGMWEHLHGPNHPDVALALHSLGSTLQFQGRYDEAIPYFEQALDRMEASTGLDNSRAANIYGSMARTYTLMGRLDEAGVAMEASLAIRERVYGPDSEALAVPFSLLGNLRAEQGLYAQALAAYERIQELHDRHGEYDRVNFENRALTYRDMGDTARMMQMYEASVAEAARVHPDEPLARVSALITLGQAQGRLGQWEEAAATLGEAYELRRAELGDDSWFVWNALSLHGWALLGTEEWERAGPVLHQAFEGLQASDRTGDEDTIDLRTRETAQRLSWFYDQAGDDAERERWESIMEELGRG